MDQINKTLVKRPFRLDNRQDPELFREVFPYKRVSRIEFDDSFILPRTAEPMFITDTTFRDGQQARPPYSVKQIVEIYDMLHRLGGMSGLIRQSEFFVYSDKDRKAVEECMARDYKYPQVTGWVRANKNDLKLIRDMGIRETGLLTSVSDYHIFLKLDKDREAAMNSYLAVVEQALEWGIMPRCHFEDVTRADIYGFVVPFAQKLMRLAEQTDIPIKIRMCDTMGYGVPYPGAALPRSVPKLVRVFTDKAGVPGSCLEWHGHNDFHKGLINAVTAWLYGCSGANGTLLGFGERTGNTPIEGLVIDYISLTGNDDYADTTVISEIAEYFQTQLDYKIPDNYPFVGRDFNATSAGIHVDGLAKNQEIYNIFDTEKILGRPVPIIITDKSGKAGVAYWINMNLKLPKDKEVSKRHPAVAKIYSKIMDAYEKGRTTSFSNQEMTQLVRRYMPEVFASEFEHLKEIAAKIASKIILKLAKTPCIRNLERNTCEVCLREFLEEYPFIQYLYITDAQGHLITKNITHIEDAPKYETVLPGTDYSNREWFLEPIRTGNLHITDFYRSQFTGKLCLTVSAAVVNDNDDIQGVLGADIRFEELLKRQGDLDDEERDQMV